MSGGNIIIYVTGDTHRDFTKIYNFCKQHNTSKEDTMIILGDVCINYYGNYKDVALKKRLRNLPITILAIKGNHENYAKNINSYKLVDYKNAKAFIEREYPNLVFAKDGEIYEFLIDGVVKKAIAIGGAFSIDKNYRIKNNMKWFPDEQPSEKTKKYVEKQISKTKNIDYVLSHTSPLRYEPREFFITVEEPSSVDNSTETWLDSIFDKINFKKWYIGHYHGDKAIDNMRFLFDDFVILGD